ncbi:MAG TPA: SET domain-containing protein-lysine N-methyltransferase [Fibrobacteria bacterium]|nr:SET domain-containing protein-lysine N-methyltransferase [Fibrobacteria bacterium]
MEALLQTRYVADEQDSRLYTRESGLHGLGVFTREVISAGTPVITCGGILKGKEEITETTRALQVGPEIYLVEDPDNPGYDDLINHSCTPNLAFSDGSLTLFAIRDIAPDEELTWDYSTAINEEGWSVECRCGSAGCRGRIMSYCDLPVEERQRLQGMILGYLR